MSFSSSSKQQQQAALPPRPESPPFVSSEMHQDMETYQRNFWIRQMEKVEEQVSIPDEQAAAVLAASKRASKRITRNEEGGEEEEEDDDANAAGQEEEESEGETTPITFEQMTQSAKELMDLFKPQAGQLPLARIKKVMKASDDEVKMISAEAPILFARACEIFIADLTCRSYMNAIKNRRRTVQRSDVVAAVAGSNLFDFLVDIIPRGQQQESTNTNSALNRSSKQSGKQTDEEMEEEVGE